MPVHCQLVCLYSRARSLEISDRWHQLLLRNLRYIKSLAAYIVVIPGTRSIPRVYVGLLSRSALLHHSITI